jgi:predicted  nucleic acid-binding Zn-ribbon protein
MANSGALPIEQQLADAFNANNSVMAYVVGITNAKLPMIPSAPNWYNTFETAFTDAQIHANGWFSIATGLVSIPNAIAGYGIVFRMNVSTINSLIGYLRSNPKDQAAIKTLSSLLKDMLSQIRSYSGSAVAFHQKILDFSNSLKADAVILSNAVSDSTKTQQVDAQQIANFNADIASMQAEIEKLQGVVTAGALVAGIGLFVGCVIATFTMGIGLAFGVVCFAGGITMIIVASNKIKSLKEKIAEDQRLMSDVTKQASSLAGLNVQINKLIDLSKAAGEQIGLILKVWEELEGDITVVLDDLNKCQGDVSSYDLDGLQRDLSVASDDWQTLLEFCNIVASVKYAQATPAVATL